MKDILVLLVLLNAQTIKVCALPYEADSDGNCLNTTTQYLLDDFNLCCKKCPPGQRMKKKCSETTETECEPCQKGQYMESWNYYPKCFSCIKCKPVKGLQDVQTCSSTTRSNCGCQPGMYCVMGFDDPYCAECNKYNKCKPGYGVSVPGTPDSDVRCEPCSNGTFSDTNSYTDRCRPHTNCRVVVRQGDATSDTVCASEPENIEANTQLETLKKAPHSETTSSTIMSTVSATSDFKAPRGATDAALSTSRPVSEALFNHSTKSPPPSIVSDSKLVAVIASVIGVILIFIAIILPLLWKTIWKKERFPPKVDANGNCETSDKINIDYWGETQMTSSTVTSPEQQLLLERGEACSDQSQCSNNTETLTRTDGCSSNESIGPLQSTVAFHNPHSALSEPRTLLSNTETFTPQTSIPTQCSSQPTSPQNVTPSPQLNININVLIGNGSGGTASVMPTNLMHVDTKLPFGEEEESFSIPQQEAGKQSLMSVQESESNSVT